MPSASVGGPEDTRADESIAAGIRVRLASRVTATEMTRPGAIVRKKPSLASSRARKAMITTSAELATAWPTRRTEKATAAATRRLRAAARGSGKTGRRCSRCRSRTARRSGASERGVDLEAEGVGEQCDQRGREQEHEPDDAIGRKAAIGLRKTPPTRSRISTKVAAKVIVSALPNDSSVSTTLAASQVKPACRPLPASSTAASSRSSVTASLTGSSAASPSNATCTS